jgi:hypothetical protein
MCFSVYTVISFQKKEAADIFIILLAEGDQGYRSFPLMRDKLEKSALESSRLLPIFTPNQKLLRGKKSSRV